MITLRLEIDGELQTYNVPESWEDVTVEHFISLWDVQAKKYDTKLEMSIDVISRLLKIDLELIYMMDIKDYNKLLEAIKFIDEKIVPEDLPQSVIVDDEEYFLKKDFDKLNMGEVISLNILLEKYENDITLAMPELLCIFLRKKNGGDELESFKSSMMQRAEMFKKVNITKVHNLFTFFLTGNDSLPNNTKDYLEGAK
jgi:hypothetical protein